jgi:hypothetical protein
MTASPPAAPSAGLFEVARSFSSFWGDQLRPSFDVETQMLF